MRCSQNSPFFHILRIRLTHQVPLSKLGRVKNMVRPSLVTLPRFVRDQAKYKATLRQIARLNGILPDGSLAEIGTKKNGGVPALGIATKTRRTVPAGTKRTGKRAQALPKLAAAPPALVDGRLDVLSESDETLQNAPAGASAGVGGGAGDAGAQVVTTPATWCGAEREGTSTSPHGRGGSESRKTTVFGGKTASLMTAPDRPHTSPAVDRCEYVVAPRATRAPRRLHPVPPTGGGPRPLSAEELTAHEKAREWRR